MDPVEDEQGNKPPATRRTLPRQKRKDSIMDVPIPRKKAKLPVETRDSLARLDPSPPLTPVARKPTPPTTPASPKPVPKKKPNKKQKVTSVPVLPLPTDPASPLLAVPGTPIDPPWMAEGWLQTVSKSAQGFPQEGETIYPTTELQENNEKEDNDENTETKDEPGTKEDTKTEEMPQDDQANPISPTDDDDGDTETKDEVGDVNLRAQTSMGCRAVQNAAREAARVALLVRGPIKTQKDITNIVTAAGMD
jgi:hypothetical protein